VVLPLGMELTFVTLYGSDLEELGMLHYE